MVETGIGVYAKNGSELEPYEDNTIQLSFHDKKDFFDLPHQDIRRVARDYNIKIASVHAPCFDVFNEEFLPMLRLIKKRYEVRTITLHPQKGAMTDAKKRLKEMGSEIKEMDILLGYENFEIKGKRWIADPLEMILKFKEWQGQGMDFLALTWDTGHTNPEGDEYMLAHLYEQIKKKEADDLIRIIHLSNRGTRRGKGHIPYSCHGQHEINAFLSQLREDGYRGQIFLDYNHRFFEREINDNISLEEFFSQKPELDETTGRELWAEDLPEETVKELKKAGVL